MDIKKNEQDFKFDVVAAETDKLAYTVLNRLDEAVVLVDREWRCRYLNDASLQNLNKSREEVLGHLIWDIHPDLIGTKFAELYKAAKKTGRKYEVEEYFAPFQRWYRVKVYPLDDGLIILSKDITARKTAEAQRELSDSIINASLDVIATIDLNGNITSWNKGAEKLLGYTENEVLGKPLSEVTPEYRGTLEENMLKKVFYGGEIEAFETKRLQKDGKFVYLSMALSPIKNSLGVTVGVSAIGRDISKIKQVTEELRKSQRLYAFLSAINQSIVRSKTKNELLDKACQIALEIGKYSLVWIGLLDKDQKLKIANLHGSEEIKERIGKILNLDYSRSEFAQTPIVKALKTGSFALCNDIQNDLSMEPWQLEFTNFGIQSNIIFPLKKKGIVIGICGFYSLELNYFEDIEIKLLSEAVSEISFGLEMLENKENEAAAETRLIQSKANLDESQKMAHVGSSEIDILTNTEIWSEEQFRIFGYEPYEVVPSFTLYLSHLHPDDAGKTSKKLRKVFDKKKDTEDTFRIVTKKGEVKHITAQVKFEFDSNGVATKIFGTTQDVTKREESEEKLRYSEAFNHGVINSLSAHVAVLDNTGKIIATNEAWDKCGMHHKNITLPRLAIGENLFERCEADRSNTVSQKAFTIMKGVLDGKKQIVKMEYQCRQEKDNEWFNFGIMKFADEGEMIVVAHENITNLKLAEQELANTLLELEERVYKRTQELDEINLTFTDSINYAKRIQMGILTSPNELKSIFRDSFLLSSPLNILSGDFFWCFERNNLKYIVVADSTGHGVPGALMSIVGNTILNRIIKENDRMVDPAKILYELDKKLIKGLQGDDEGKVMDGMDLAVCVVDYTNKTIHFAGAFRPLFILDIDGSVLEIHGNRSCIGRGIDLQLKTFETKVHNFKKGQTMYLTSDGYYSQFGGAKGKKMMKTAFKGILQNLFQIPINEQKEIMKNEFKKWKGEQEQVDDILIVGIKL
jgi:PAS domain S-box-containing protein